MSNNSIIISQHDKWVLGEALAAGAIMPGHILAFDANGKLVVHPSDSGECAPVIVALENPYAVQSGTTKAIDTAYASADTVFYGIPPAGGEFYALVAASASAVAAAAHVISDGDGCVKVWAAQADTDGGANPDPSIVTRRIVGLAREAVDNSANAASTARIKVMAV